MNVWVAASIPFWLAGAVLTLAVIGGWAHVLLGGTATREEQWSFNRFMWGSIVCLLLAGVAFYIAAKVAS